MVIILERKITKTYWTLCTGHFSQLALCKFYPRPPCFCCTLLLLLLWRDSQTRSVGRFGNLLALPCALRKYQEVNTQKGHLWPLGNNKCSSFPSLRWTIPKCTDLQRIPAGFNSNQQQWWPAQEHAHALAFSLVSLFSGQACELPRPRFLFHAITVPPKFPAWKIFVSGSKGWPRLCWLTTYSHVLITSLGLPTLTGKQPYEESAILCPFDNQESEIQRWNNRSRVPWRGGGWRL